MSGWRSRLTLEGAGQPGVLRYGVAIIAVGLVTFVKWRVHWLGAAAPVATNMGAVMFVAWAVGTGPALLATALSCLAGAYFFSAPYLEFAVAAEEDAARLVIAGIEGAVISGFVGLLHRRNSALAQALDARERADQAVRRTTQQVIQAQKMRSVGEFAGGVAHDFNNMLTVVTGCAELAAARLPEGHPARPEVLEIRAAAERAAALARQLLVFSRKRDVDPKVVALHEVIARAEPMLHRIAGKGVKLELRLEAARPYVLVDVAQLEHALTNLVANGRDAMPTGGTLTIATADGGPPSPRAGGAGGGAQVELTVKDTGVGMEEATKARVFEPFFTTKEPGAGTGLGLSVVFGIIESVGGEISVESSPRLGSTFRIRLPLASPEPRS